jgi:hypothetical protein
MRWCWFSAHGDGRGYTVGFIRSDELKVAEWSWSTIGRRRFPILSLDIGRRCQVLASVSSPIPWQEPVSSSAFTDANFQCNRCRPIRAARHVNECSGCGGLAPEDIASLLHVARDGRGNCNRNKKGHVNGLTGSMSYFHP